MVGVWCVGGRCECEGGGEAAGVPRWQWWYGLGEGWLFRATSTCWLVIALAAFSVSKPILLFHHHEAVTGPRYGVSKLDERRGFGTGEDYGS